jgi:hypothetical protein
LSTTQINGGTQIRANTVTSGQVDATVIVAGGGNAFTGDQSFGNHKITNLLAPVSGTDGANKSYVDAAVQGLSDVHTARAGTNTETLTIASGSVTTIGGTTTDGQSPAVGEYIFVPNAPAATGAAGGATYTTQPANGLYQVTAVGANLTVGRASEISGTNPPFGKRVTVVSGTTWGGGEYMVTTPGTNAAFTYGTGNIGFGQVNGLADITVDSTLTKAGNQLSRPALTGDVTAATGSNATAIAAGAVTLSKMANLAANTVIGNATGSPTTPTAVSMTNLGTASTVAYRDASGNLKVNNYARGVATTVTAAGTTTLVVGSAMLQQFTGTTTQTVVLPDATTLVTGHTYAISNQSTGVVTVNMNGGSLLRTVPANTSATVTLLTNGTAAGTWDPGTTAAAAGGTVSTVSVATANGFAGTVTNPTTTPAITLTTSVTGVLKGNGTAISAATVGTDYLAPSSLVTRETPSGTVNGSTTTFTLANTPISGTECVFLNGVLQEPGAGNDYTISGATITYLTAPITGDRIRVNYQK